MSRYLTFADKSWGQCVLSNHFPELAVLVNDFGLNSYFEHVFTFTTIGYKKPHLGLFEYALSRLPKCNNIWIIGESYNAEIIGADAANLTAVLVRQTHRFYTGVTNITNISTCALKLPNAIEMLHLCNKSAYANMRSQSRR